MTFDPSIGYGSIITIGLLIIGLVGGWYTLKSEFKERGRRQDETEARQEKLDSEFQAHRLHLSENYVKRNDLRDMEDRISKMLDKLIDPLTNRMKEVDHKLGNINQKIDDRVVAMFRMRNERE